MSKYAKALDGQMSELNIGLWKTFVNVNAVKCFNSMTNWKKIETLNKMYNNTISVQYKRRQILTIWKYKQPKMGLSIDVLKIIKCFE